jgi:hypothetical protein
MSVLLSLNHLGYPEIRGLRIGRVLHYIVGHRTGHNQVFSQRGVGGLVVAQHLCHGLDFGCVQFVELLDVFEDFVDLCPEGLELHLAKLEVSQFRHAQYVFPADFQGKFS